MQHSAHIPGGLDLRGTAQSERRAIFNMLSANRELTYHRVLRAVWPGLAERGGSGTYLGVEFGENATLAIRLAPPKREKSSRTLN
jgi:hypothetical protein